MIRNATIQDAPSIADIYNYYINHTIITFEEVEVNETEIAERIQACQLKYPWLVYEEEGKVIGYAYAGEWKSRCSYKYSVESSVYLDEKSKGKGVGTALYQALLEQLKELKIHAVIGGISLPNEASVRLHEKFGFEKVAHFKEVGNKFNQWVDVGYWELIVN